MKAKTICRMVILAILFAIACVLGVLCLMQSCMAELDKEPVSRPGVPTPEPTSWVAPDLSPQASHPEESATATPTLTQKPSQVVGSRKAAPWGTLTIGGKEIPIADNIEENILEKSPGWMPDSALPGEDGMCVILGHRNRQHLRPLQDVKPGDGISFTYADGREVLYTVTEIMIYEDTADWRLPALDGASLVLATCYPFRYSGNAPGKYVVLSRIRDKRLLVH